MILITRYAEGFLEYAKENIGFEQGLEELKKVKDVFRDNPEFEEFLKNPAINYIEKCAVVEKVLASGFSQEIRDFLKLLLKKSRIEKFEKIAEYARIKYSHGKKIKALLYTSYFMDTGTMETFKNRLEKKLNSQVQLYVDLDPEMIGGARLVIGNKILDGSVRKIFDDMKQKLIAARVG